MKSLLFPPFATAALLLAALPLRAELNPAIVPADAQWVVHADFAALRDTALGRKLIELIPEIQNPDANDPLRPNPRRILDTAGTATAFGTNFSSRPEALDGTLVLQGTADLRKIAEGFVAQLSLMKPEDAVELTDLPVEAYLLSREVIVAFPPEPIVLVGKSREQLLQALAVFRGQAPSLAQGSTRLKSLLPRSGSYYLMGATMVPTGDGEMPDVGPEARILQMTQAASFAIGEENEHAVAGVKLVASSPEVALKLVKVVEGITAMLSLAETNDQRLTEFVNSLQVARNDNAVDLRFAYPTERILQLIEQAAREHQQPKQDGPAAPEVEGELLAQWTADQALGGVAPSGDNFATHTVDAVTLAPGATLVLAGARHEGEHARWDYIELTPAGSNTPQRFEAEYMRLDGYSIEASPHASGGEMLKTNGRGSARLRFTGAAGTYRLAARYVDEQDGKATFTLSLVPPPSTE